MSQIGELSVKIGADTGELKRGLDQAGHSINELGGKMRGGINVAGKYAAALTAAGAALVAAMVTKTMQAIDEQAKFARQINSTIRGVENLNVAARNAGVSKDQMRTALQRLDVQLGEAAKGSGRAADTLSRLNLTARELQSIDADQRIALINERIREFIPPAERGAVAAELFGRRMGRALGEIDEQAIAKAAEEVEALGLAVSEVDAATIERANDAMASIGEIVRGAANRITVTLAPVIEHVAQLIRGAAIESRGFEQQIVKAMSTALTATKWVADSIRGLQVVLKGIMTIAAGVGSIFTEQMRVVVNAITGTIDTAIRSINFFIRQANKIRGVNIGELSLVSENEFIKNLDMMLESGKLRFEQLKEELKNLMNEPMPSEGIDELIEKIKFAADEASRATVEAHEGLRNFDTSLVQEVFDEIDEIKNKHEEKDIERMERERERMMEKMGQDLERLRHSLLTEEEAELEHYIRRMEMLSEFHANNLLSDEEFNELKEREQERHWQAMEAIQERALRAMENAQRKSAEIQKKTQEMSTTDMLGEFEQFSRSMFGKSKIAAVAGAIMSVHRGIAKALELGWPLGPIAAAKIAAQGFASVRSIQGQSFSTSGNTSSTGPVASAPIAPVQQQTTSVNITGVDPGQMFSGSQVRQLIESINNEVGNGMVLRFA